MNQIYNVRNGKPFYRKMEKHRDGYEMPDRTSLKEKVVQAEELTKRFALGEENVFPLK